MAKIIEDTITIKFSRLVKDDDTESTLIDVHTVASIETIIQELVGDQILVETA